MPVSPISSPRSGSSSSCSVLVCISRCVTCCRCETSRSRERWCRLRQRPSWEWDWPGFWIGGLRSEEHTSELQSLMRISYAVFCLKTKHLVIDLYNNTHSL